MDLFRPAHVATGLSLVHIAQRDILVRPRSSCCRVGCVVTIETGPCRFGVGLWLVISVSMSGRGLLSLAVVYLGLYALRPGELLLNNSLSSFSP